MSNKNSLRFLVVILSAAFATAALVSADAGALGQNANSGTTEDTAAAAPQSTEDLSGERVDLSGTYTGRITTTGGHEMSGEGTLTITGNTFTLTGEGMTHNGRVYAVLTRGATSAAFYFADIQDPATSTPVVFNVRARKSGERLTLTPAPGSRNRMTFGTAGGAGGRRRGRRSATTTDMNANTGDATNTNTTTPPR